MVRLTSVQTKKLKGPTETDILRGIRQYLQLRGWFVIRNQQNIGSHPGLTDLTAIKNGVVWWIEVKKPGGKLSKAQEKFRDNVIAAGGRWMAAYSVEDVVERLS
jgi:hypothetical protein